MDDGLVIGCCRDDDPDVACDCPCHSEEYAELQAENLAAADLDPNWPAVYE